MLQLIPTAIILVIGWLGYKESKKGNVYAKIGVLVGIISTIVMIFLFLPEKEIEYDVINYYDDGTLRFIGNGTFERKEDTWKWYSENGILVKYETYDDNELDGEYKEYYNNGNLKIHGEYDDGEKDLDEWKCYNKDGTIKECDTAMK